MKTTKKPRAEKARTKNGPVRRVPPQASGSPLGGAIALLRRYNKWRRGDGDDMPSSTAISEALDLVCLCAESDARRLDWLQAQEVRRARETGTHSQPFDFLVLAEDGTTCWGKTYREAIDTAAALGEGNNRDEPRSPEQPLRPER